MRSSDSPKARPRLATACAGLGDEQALRLEQRVVLRGGGVVRPSVQHTHAPELPRRADALPNRTRIAEHRVGGGADGAGRLSYEGTDATRSCKSGTLTYKAKFKRVVK